MVIIARYAAYSSKETHQSELACCATESKNKATIAAPAQKGMACTHGRNGLDRFCADGMLCRCHAVQVGCAEIEAKQISLHWLFGCDQGMEREGCNTSKSRECRKRGCHSPHMAVAGVRSTAKTSAHENEK